MSTSQVYECVRQGWLAPPVKIFPNSKAVGWCDDEIDRYVEARRAERDDALKAAAEQPAESASRPEGRRKRDSRCRRP
jgi:hypothetical protein